MRYELTVNGERRSFDADPDCPLLWVLRDALGLTGTKYGCGVGFCGACTVHVAGETARACMLPVSEAVGRPITTIEGLSPDLSHPVQRAWIAEDVPQCGYCQPGMIMAAARLIRGGRDLRAADVDAALAGHVCRCGTYLRIRRAVLLAAASSPERDA
jgi:isoquinoline 1-oxidoreductase alpha subunit